MFLRTFTLFFAATGFLLSQVTGRVQGTVLDTAAAPIPGAKVSLQLGGSNSTVYTTTTSVEGLFFVSAVRPEVYDLVVEASGFQKKITRSNES